MDVEAGLADVGDGRLYYEVAGSGSPLVLIHGFTLDRCMWDDRFDAGHLADMEAPDVVNGHIGAFSRRRRMIRRWR